MTIHREKAKNEANILHHQLQSLTPKPPSRQEPLFEPKPGPAESSRPQPDIQPDTKYRSPPVYYEHTLSPSAVRKRSARVKRYLSSNDETDDSIMKEISKCFSCFIMSDYLPLTHPVTAYVGFSYYLFSKKQDNFISCFEELLHTDNEPSLNP